MKNRSVDFIVEFAKKAISNFCLISIVAIGVWQLWALASYLSPVGEVAAGEGRAQVLSAVNWLRKRTGSKSQPQTCLIEIGSFDQELRPERITISKINLDLAVVSVPVANGTWKVNDGVANFAEGTSLINGKSGNTGIYGHDLPSTFLKIKDLAVEDEVTVLAGDYRATYRVISSSVTDSAQVDVFYPSEEPVLTLVTCEGVFSERRYVVKAELVRIEKDNCVEE